MTTKSKAQAPVPQAIEKVVPVAPSSKADLDVSRERAKSAAMGMQAEMRAKQQQEKRAEEAKTVRYVICQVCDGPGIWMFNEPSDNGFLHPDDWEASYKPRGIPWPSKDVYCQCCLERSKTKVSLKMTHDYRGNVRPYRTHIATIPTEEYERLMGVNLG